MEASGRAWNCGAQTDQALNKDPSDFSVGIKGWRDPRLEALTAEDAEDAEEFQKGEAGYNDNSLEPVSADIGLSPLSCLSHIFLCDLRVLCGERFVEDIPARSERNQFAGNVLIYSASA